jgi:superfamily I DNA/RNA helicase
MKLTQEQAAALAAACHMAETPGIQTLIVEAVPGAGKTYTLTAMAETLAGMGKKTVAVAFNKANATALATKFEERGVNADAFTLHALANRIARAGGSYASVDSKKAARLGQQVVGNDKPRLAADIAQAAELSLLSMSKPGTEKHIEAMGNAGLSLDAADMEKVEIFMRNSAAEADRKKQAKITFAEMLWIPVDRQLTGIQYDAVLVDEAQDLSPLMLALIKQITQPNAVVVFVGDSRQAINGFAGAGLSAMADAQQLFGNGQVQHLSVSFRCPRGHVALAQNINPAMTAHPDAPDGVVETITLTQETLLQAATPGSAVIARTTAQVVQAAMSLSNNGRKVIIRGKKPSFWYDIQAASRNAADVTDMIQSLTDTLGERLERAAKYSNRAKVEAMIEEAHDAAVAFLSGLAPDTMPKDAVSILSRMFSEEDNPDAVTCSTVHRFKGQERDTVIVLTDKLPLPNSSTPEQEENIKYVALTRSRNRMVLAAGSLE